VPSCNLDKEEAEEYCGLEFIVKVHAFLTSSLDEGDGELHASATLLQGAQSQVPPELEAGWALEPVRTLRRK